MQSFEIFGGKKLSGEITIRGAKNSAVALLAASVLNEGITRLNNMPEIEEVNRWIEILESLGMKIEKSGKTLILYPPRKYRIDKINREASNKTRSVILLLSALAKKAARYSVPQSGGCKLGTRTVRPHLFALENFGIKIKTKAQEFEVDASSFHQAGRFVLYETGDTVTETALIAAAQTSQKTTIKMASANYMVQDLCFFLEQLGVRIKGIGNQTLEVWGLEKINKNVSYEIGEDPIESMFYISAAIVTKSTLIVRRCPIEFLELELLKLQKMGQRYEILKAYRSKNKKTELVDIKIFPSKLTALEEKIHSLPFPGINMDNLPFFVPIAMVARGKTLIHDWTYENRAIYYTELNRLGGKVTLMDPHRVYIEGPTKITPVTMMSPPALRPAAIILVAMLAAKGKSVLKDAYSINRGYENLEGNLKSLGADIKLK